MFHQLTEALRRHVADLSLRTKFLGALLVGAGIPLLIAAAFYLAMSLDSSARNAQSLMRDKLHIASLVMDNSRMELLKLNRAISQESMMAVNLGLLLYQPIAQHLRDLIHAQRLAFAVVLDDSGTVVASARQPDRLEPNLQPLPTSFLTKAIEQDGASFFLRIDSDKFSQAENLTMPTARHLLCLASLMPIRDHLDTLMGYCFAGILLDPDGSATEHRTLTTLSEQLEVPFLFMDQDGLLSTTLEIIVPTSTALPIPTLVFDNLNQTPTAISQILEINNKRYRINFLSLPGIDGKPVASFGIALSDDELNRIRNIGLIFTTLVLLLAFSISILLSRLLAYRLARPILAIAASTKEIIRGNFDLDLNVRGHDEIGQMTDDFAVMAHQLKKMIDELNREVKERSEAENRVRLLNDELEIRVQNRTTALTDTNIALTESLELLHKTQQDLIESEKMAALNTLVAGVAHEINTPIGNAIMAVSFLKEQYSIVTTALADGKLRRNELESFLDTVLSVQNIAGNSLDRAANVITFFKQVANNSGEEQAILIELRRFCDEILFTMHARSQYPHISFENSISKDIKLLTYPSALFQILSNLLANAMEHAFTEHTPVTLPHPAEIRLAADPSPHGLELRISDNGHGMNPEMLPRVFEPFFTTGRGRGHLGLGLSITYNLVHNSLHGSIVCQSGTDAGTTFIIRLSEEMVQIEKPDISD